MRANQWALSALCAEIYIENRDFQCYVAFFVGGGSQWEGAVNREQAHWYLVTTTGNNFSGYIFDEVRCAVGDGASQIKFSICFLRDSYFVQICQSFINGPEIQFNKSFTFSSIGFFMAIL